MVKTIHVYQDAAEDTIDITDEMIAFHGGDFDAAASAEAEAWLAGIGLRGWHEAETEG